MPRSAPRCRRRPRLRRARRRAARGCLRGRRVRPPAHPRAPPRRRPTVRAVHQKRRERCLLVARPSAQQDVAHIDAGGPRGRRWWRVHAACEVDGEDGSPPRPVRRARPTCRQPSCHMLRWLAKEPERPRSGGSPASKRERAWGPPLRARAAALCCRPSRAAWLGAVFLL
eukprot:5356847-Prymnesium_polylepis.1